MSMNNGTFDAPVPGQSLTQPVGGSPSEHPPKFVNLDEALNFTWDKLHNPKGLVKLIGMLKAKTPVEVLARTVIYQGLLKNLWTVDVGLLMLQTVIWQIEAIAKLKKIKVQTFVEDTAHTKSIVTIGNLLDSKQTQDSINENVQKQTETNTFKGFF